MRTSTWLLISSFSLVEVVEDLFHLHLLQRLRGLLEFVGVKAFVG
jgi:hypothetical protein